MVIRNQLQFLEKAQVIHLLLQCNNSLYGTSYLRSNYASKLFITPGGGAVHFLMLSPLSKGLFHRALSQSGNVLNDFIYSRYPKEQSQSLAKRVGCPAEPSEDMVKCLKTVDGRDIVETHREMRV